MTQLTDYQRGIDDLQKLLRKHGTVLCGCDNLKEAYHKFLADKGIKRKRPTKNQLENLEYLQQFLPHGEIWAVKINFDSSNETVEL